MKDAKGKSREVVRKRAAWLEWLLLTPPTSEPFRTLEKADVTYLPTYLLAI